MKKLHLLLLLLPFAAHAQAPDTASCTRNVQLMGTWFELTAIAATESAACTAVDSGIAEIARIDDLLTTWDSISPIMDINRAAGKEPVKSPDEIIQLIKRCRKISALTYGAFDITFAVTEKLFTFDKRTVEALPDSEAVRNSVQKIGYEKIQIDEEAQTVLLKEAGMRIGFGAIGGGYAANRASLIMQRLGAGSGVVNASGDLIAWGQPMPGRDWKVGVGHPDDPSSIIAWFWVSDMAVCTSGNYEKYFICNGIRYGHIINPVTGWPSRGLKSATVLCPDAELADALATGIFVLGPEDGLALINQLHGVECLIVTDDNRILTSEGLDMHLFNESDARDWNIKTGK